MSFKIGDLCIIIDGPKSYVVGWEVVIKNIDFHHLTVRPVDKSGTYKFYPNELKLHPLSDKLCKKCYTTITYKNICCDCEKL